MTAPSKAQALAAIVEWMGAYEGNSGRTLADLVEAGVPDDEITDDQHEWVPADMLAGYRLAVRQYEAHIREIGEAAAFRRLRAEHPTASSERIRAAIRAAR